ncbi:hypothetical protein JCM10450v2_001223 [Rhodotorula kratochvilovae]
MSSGLEKSLFQLKFTTKQLQKQSKKAAKDEGTEKAKLKKALQQGNAEGARIYASNAIRKKNESLNLLRLSSRIDAVASRVETAVTMRQVTGSMTAVVKNMDRAMQDMNLERISAVMDRFESQFEDLDVQTGYLEGTLSSDTAIAAPSDQIDSLMAAVADEAGLEIQHELQGKSTEAVPALEAPRQTVSEEQEDALAQRLRALRPATSFVAIAHDIKANAGEHTVKDKDGYVFDEKRAVSPSSPSTYDQADHPDAPTEEEKLTLRRVPGPINFAAFLVAYVELAERFSYYGCTVVFTNFIQRPLPEGSTTGAILRSGDQAGALGMGQQASTGIITFNSFWVYCVPLFGAYIADTYLGRYNTICWAVVIALVGHVLLIAAAAPSVIQNHDAALGLFGASRHHHHGRRQGMFKSNVSPLIAEQVASHPTYVKTQKNGTHVIVDPAQTTARMYNVRS